MSIFERIARALLPAPKPVYKPRSPRDRRRWPDWLSNGLTLDRMGDILRKADIGDLEELMGLLQEIAGREALVSGLLSVRLSSLSQRPLKVKPNTRDSNQDRAILAANHVQEVLDNLKCARTEGERLVTFGGIKSVTEGIVKATYYGLAVPWINWSERDGFLVPTSLEFLDERRFRHDLGTDSISIVSEESSYSGKPLSSYDPYCYIEVRNARLSNRVAMAGFGRAILLPWWLRFGTLKDLTNYVETWGRPGLVVKADGSNPAGYDEDQYEQLQQFLEDYMGDTRVLLPPGFAAELMEAQSGGEKIFETIDNMTERHIQFAAVGQVGAIAGDATTYAAGAQAQRVRDDLTEGDARLVTEVFEKLGRYATTLRFGADCPAPFVEFTSEKSTDAIKERALAIQAGSYPLTSMLKSGIPIDIRTYCNDLGIPLRADGTMDPKYLENIQAMAAMGVVSSDNGAAQ